MDFLKMAVSLANNCPERETAFAVGAVIASETGTIISTGYSREFGQSWHAEEVAIEKARRNGVNLDRAVIYSSMEPCGERLSGRTTCCEHIVRSGIKRVVYCLDEPSVFVQPQGASLLRKAGIVVEQDERLKDDVIRANQNILNQSSPRMSHGECGCIGAPYREKRFCSEG
jgi:diaminohydroxyphosphoribosylaminopyrimidine deaminase / 5-amino-6-(5-phosphoribosylamino)uracil reductase